MQCSWHCRPTIYPSTLGAIATLGRHIYCEKPLAIDVAGVHLAVIDISRQLEGKVVFHVGLQVPWAAAFRELTRRIHAGGIGTIATAQSFFYFGGGGRVAPAGVGRDEGRIRTWAGDRVLSGDVVVEQNVHGLDKINRVLKAQSVLGHGTGPRARSGPTDFGNIRDNFEAVLTYPADVTVSLHSTQFGPGINDAGKRFFGSRGVSESHYTSGVRIFGAEPWDAGVTDIIADAETNKYRASFTTSRRAASTMRASMAPRARSPRFWSAAPPIPAAISLDRASRHTGEMGLPYRPETVRLISGLAARAGTRTAQSTSRRAG